jgi:hypothetical protein
LLKANMKRNKTNMVMCPDSSSVDIVSQVKCAFSVKVFDFDKNQGSSYLFSRRT